MKKTFDVLYYKSKRTGEQEFSHKYREDWETTDLYCPGCGVTNVWVRTDGGDYYVGEMYICTSCSNTFYLPGGVGASDSKIDAQRLNNLGEW
jgi:transposase-like protein